MYFQVQTVQKFVRFWYNKMHFAFFTTSFKNYICFVQGYKVQTYKAKVKYYTKIIQILHFSPPVLKTTLFRAIAYKLT